MPERDPSTPTRAHRVAQERARLEASLRALEKRYGAARSRADRARIEARAEPLRQRRAQLVAALPGEDLLEAMRRKLVEATDKDNFGGALEASVPVLLLPMRLQTRFVPVDGQTELRIRFLPDTIAIRSHEPELTVEERALGDAYWAAVAAADGDAAKRLAAWGALVAGVLGAERAAWIAVATDPDGDRNEGALERLEAWTRAPAADVLPERFTVRGYRGEMMVFEETTKRLVPPTLDVGFDPAIPGANAGDAETMDELVNGLPPQLRWLTDFGAAEELGMALRVRIRETGADAGLDRLVVLGVRVGADAHDGATLVEDLLDAHHYTDGFAVAPRGAPTNNTEESGAWYSPSPAAAETHATERGDPLFELDDPDDTGLDGPELARALGIDAEVLQHVRGADGTDQRDASNMARALWPATWGYFLKQILAATIPAETISRLRRHFVEHVRGRGPLPPIRAGQNPYGVLPVTSLDSWQAADADAAIPSWLPRTLRAMSSDWLTMSESTPRIGRTPDAARELYDLMTMQATSASFAASAVYGEELTGWIGEYLGIFSASWGNQLPHLEKPAKAVEELRRRLRIEGDARPRLSTLLMDEPAPVTGMSIVHTEVGPQPVPGTPNYIAWLATAPVDDIRAERGVPEGATGTLLYRILRHSILSAYVETAKTIKVQAGTLPAALQFEAELVGMPGLGTASGYAHLEDRFDAPGGLEQVRIKDYLGRIDRASLKQLDMPPVWLEEFVELRESLARLATVSTERLQLLLSETLDCCSHRLDAWITSLATRRLRAMRAARPAGTYVGVYGWVEKLEPRAGPAGGGWVLAPSSSHATAAAMLRSGYLSREGPARGTLAVDLSSHRAKQALWMFESIRAGNSLAEVLGYRFERLLHDAPIQLGLEQYLPAVREAFPLDTGVLIEPDGPADAIAARAVVNGLALHDRWMEIPKAARSDPGLNLFGNTTLPTMGSDAGKALASLLDQLAETHDAMADVALAESVYQAGRGEYERAGAAAQAMSGQRQMPEIEVMRTPRTGTTIRNRVVLSLEPVPDGALKGWPAGRTARAAAAPEVNRWLAAAIGDPTTIRCLVRYRQGNALRLEWMQLSSLDVDAIDLVTFSVAADTAREAELEERIRYALTAEDATRHDIEISFDDGPPWSGAPPRPDEIRTVSEVAELLRTLQRLLGGARPAVPSDLAAPDRAAEAPLAGLDVTRLAGRAATALGALWGAYAALRPLVEGARTAEADRVKRNADAVAAKNAPAPGDEAPDAAPLDGIRAASFALGWFSVSGAVIPGEPDVPAGNPVAAQTRWDGIVDRAEAALREAGKRLVAALKVATKDDLDQAAADETRAALAQFGTDAVAAAAAVQEAVAGGADAAAVEAAGRTRDAAFETAFSRCAAVLRTVFGKGFIVAPPLVFGAEHPLAAGHTTASPGALEGATPSELARWVFQVAQAHPTLTELELATTMSSVQTGGGSFDLSASQVPFANGVRWAALDRAGAAFPPGLLSTVFVGRVRFSDADDERFAGLVLAEWEEVVPNATETAALTFQFDQPASEPPQALLLAVPGVLKDGARWTRGELFAIVEDAMKLARIRTVDPAAMRWYGAALPALYFTQNFANDAPSTTFQGGAAAPAAAAGAEEIG